MKILSVLLIALAVTLSSFAEDTARERAKRRMAIRSAAKRVIEDIDTLSSDRGVDRVLLNDMISKAMSSDINTHRSRESSQSACEALVKSARREFFNVQLTNAVSAAQQHSPLDLKAEEVLLNVSGKWSELVDRKISEFMDENYKELFSQTRERAVALQRRVVDKGISYPAPDEIDAALTGLKKGADRLAHEDFGKLTEWVRAFTYKDIQSVFDENISYVDSLGSKVLSDINAQYDAQIKVLDDAAKKISDSSAAVTAEGAKNEIIAAVESFTAKKQKKAADGDVPVCGMFEIVEKAAGKAAKRLESEKFIAYINGIKDVPVSASDIENDINGSKKAYRTESQGIDKLLYDYGPGIKRFTTSGYAGKIKDKAEDYSDYFENLLNDNSEIAAAYNKKARLMLKDKAAPVRQKIAEADYRKYFDRIKDGTTLDEKLIEYAHDNRKRFPVKDIKSIVRMFKQAGSDALKSLETAREDFLEETEEKAVSNVNESITSGRDAMDEQARIVNEMEKTRRSELQEEVNEGKSLNKILADWGDDLEDSWKKYAKENSTEYKKIFRRTSELLNKTVRQFYESVEQAEQTTVQSKSRKKSDIEYITEKEASLDSGEQEQQEEMQMDASSGGGGASAAAEARASEMAVSLDLPKTDADCLMILDNSRMFRCDAKLITGEGEELTSVRISPKKVDKASEDISGAISGALARILETKKGDTNPTLKMFVIIKSDDIRHKMSIMLMQKVREQVAAWSKDNMPDDNQVELLWSVGF